MLSSRARLIARQGTKDDALSREEYLAQLMAECTSPSTSTKAKEQCMAHLANFSYDPINFAYFKRLNVVDMFIDLVDEMLPVAAHVPPPSRKSSNHHLHAITVTRLAMQGICNVAPDERFQQILMDNDAIPLIVQASFTPDQVTCAAALSTLYFLLDAPSTLVPTTALRQNDDVLARIRQCTLHEDAVIRNIAVSFIAYSNDIKSGCNT